MCRRRYDYFIFLRPGGFYTDSKNDILLNFSVTARENDLQDTDISNLLDNMGADEMKRLEQWFMAKNGLGSNSTPTPPPPPPPSASAPPSAPSEVFSVWYFL